MASSETIHGVRKAAVRVVLLGEESATQLLKEFSEDEVRLIGTEITRLGAVDPAEAETVLQEYLERLDVPDEGPAGGLAFARKLIAGEKQPFGVLR